MMIHIALTSKKTHSPSGNVTKNEFWAVKNKRQEYLKTQIQFSLLDKYTHAQREAAKAKKFKYIHIHSQRAKLLDYDNFVFGTKALMDVLKPFYGKHNKKIGLSLIAEDSPKWIKPVYTQKTGKPYFTSITIIDEDDPRFEEYVNENPV